MTAQAALWFLPFVTAVGLWAAWSDMKAMRIPNYSVLALLAIWLVGGPLLLPLETWGWGWAIGIVVLAIGFGLNMAGWVGAGDAKFAAAMAPFFVGATVVPVVLLFACCLIGAFVLHRALRAIPPLRRATAHWTSWDHLKFPMGMTLAATVSVHLLLVALSAPAAAAP